MGLFQSTATINKKEPKVTWFIPESERCFSISPVFTFQKENFVVVFHNSLLSLIIYCCSAIQWSYDESFLFTFKINLDKKKISTVGSFTKSKPFISINLDKPIKKLGLKIQIQPSYPYTREERYVGIRNSGATCYIASIIQVLYNLGGFRQFIFSFNKNPPETILALQRLFVELQLSSKPPSLDPLIRTLGSVYEITNVQQDSNEFLLCLFDKLENSLGAPFADGIRYMFGSEIAGNVSDSETNESFLIMPLVVDGLRGIRESLTLAVAPSANEKIGKKYFTKIPPVFGFQLCRYKFCPKEGRIIELNTPFECPEQMDIREFCCESLNEEETKYSLFAVVVHLGNPESGHYVSYIKLNQKWILFDDTKTKPATWVDVEQTFGRGDDESGDCSFLFSYGQPLAYMVFYVRDDSTRLINAGDDVPLHLAPHRSSRMFSKFIFSDQISGCDIHSVNFVEWDSRKETIREVCMKMRNDYDYGDKSVWAQFPGNSMFVGPINLDECASEFIIKGHPTVFFILPSELNDDGPLFVMSEDLPRKIIAVCTNRNLISKVPEGMILKYNGRVVKTPGSFVPGTFFHTQRNTSITVNVNSIPYKMMPSSTYADLQQRVALDMNAAPISVIFFSQTIPMKPLRYPFISTFPANVTAIILPTGITARSISLYIGLSAVLMYPSYVRQLTEPLWIPKGCDVSDVIDIVLKNHSDLRINDKLKVQYSKGTSLAIEKVLHSTDNPKKGNARFDVVRYEVPSTRSRFKELLATEQPFTIEVRMMKNGAFFGSSRLLSVTKTTTLRDIGRKMLRISDSTADTFSGYIYIAEKTKITENISIDGIVFDAMNVIAQKFTTLKQRIVLAIVVDDSFDGSRIRLSRSLSGIINPRKNDNYQ